MDDNSATSATLEILQRLSRIEQKIDNYADITKQVHDNSTAIATVKKDVDDHERRISGIEGWGKWLVGAVGMLIVAALWQGLIA